MIATVKSGAKFSGQFLGADPRNNNLGISLKWVKLLKAAPGEDKSKEGQFFGGGPEKVVVFEQTDVVEVQANGLTFGVDAPGASQNGRAPIYPWSECLLTVF